MKIIFHDYDKNVPVSQLRGYYDPNRNVISIQRTLTWRIKIEILAHEIVHWLICCVIYDVQTRLEINRNYDLLWAKMLGYDLNWVSDWYEAEAKRCGLKSQRKSP